MKILRVIASVDPATGGPIAGLRAITPELNKLGWTSEFLSVDDPHAPFLNDGIAPIHACGPAGNAYATAPALRPWLNAHVNAFDAVIVHGLWQDLGRAVRAACVKAGRPYFVFPHGMLDPSLRHAYPVRHCKKWIYWLFAERAVLRDARAVFFTCEEERRLAKTSFPLYSVNECVVKYGTAAPPEEQLALLGTQSGIDAPYWLFLGRIHSKKGIDLLLSAYAKLFADATGDRWATIPRLVIAGPCHDEAYLRSLKNSAEKLGIAEKIEWPGMLSGNAKWAALAKAEVFILPSFQENFGLAVAEALAVGTPVLLSDRVNIWRDVAADGAGFAEPVTEAGTLRLMRRWLATSPTERTAMRVASRQCFLRRFEISAVARDFSHALSTLIRRPVSAA